MKCMYCEAEMKQGVVPFHIDRKGIYLSLDEIPAWVCQQCGEAYFETKEVDLMQNLVATVEQKTKHFADKSQQTKLVAG